MIAPVDVLTVMDSVIAGEREWGAHEAANALTNARAAVADLIKEVGESLEAHYQVTGHKENVHGYISDGLLAAFVRVGGAA